MQKESLILIYINHLIKPVEQLLKYNNNSKKEQIELQKFLLRQYQTIEKIIEENHK